MKRVRVKERKEGKEGCQGIEREREGGRERENGEKEGLTDDLSSGESERHGYEREEVRK